MNRIKNLDFATVYFNTIPMCSAMGMVSGAYYGYRDSADSPKDIFLNTTFYAASGVLAGTVVGLASPALVPCAVLGGVATGIDNLGKKN